MATKAPVKKKRTKKIIPQDNAVITADDPAKVAAKTKQYPPKKDTDIDKELNTRTYKYDVSRAIKLRYEHGLSYDEIGKQLGVSGSALHQRISSVISLLGDKEKIIEFQARESDILANAREVLITAALEPEAVKKSSTLQLTTAYSQLFDKQRLIDGKSTSNVAYADMTASEAEIEKRIKQLSQSMGIDQDTTIYSDMPLSPDISETQVIDNAG